MWDVIVLGLGPSGSTAARVAAASGLKVLGIDKDVFPRHKTCAAGLTGRAQALLPLKESEFLESRIHRFIIHLNVKRPIILDSPESLMVTTRREVMDTLLMNLAASSGADIRQGCRVKNVLDRPDGVQVITENGVETSRFLIGCDGIHSVARRAVQCCRAAFVPAWEEEYRIPEGADADIRTQVRFEIGYAVAGYGWAFPRRDTISIGVAGEFRSSSAIRRAFDRIKKRVCVDGRWECLGRHGHPVPIYSKKSAIAGGRILLAGDAAGFVDPFLGEGIYYALKSGDIAANWVIQACHQADYSIANYADCIKRTIGTDLEIAARLAAIVYRFPRIFFLLTRKKPGILTCFARNLSDGKGYAHFSAGLPNPWRHLVGIR